MLVRLKQRGDTIVEVMLVLAILGSAIGISYTTANRSLLNARQAQENAEAAKLAQTQTEVLYELAKITDPGNDDYIYNPSTNFCISSVGKVVKTFPASASSNQRLIDYTDYPNDTSDPDNPKSCVQGLYHYSIRYTNNNGDNDKFTVVVVWDDVLGQGRDTVTIESRVHVPVRRDDI